MTTERVRVPVYGETHDVGFTRRVRAPLDAPRLVVASWQPNEAASQILRACLDSIRRHTPEPHELWVVDNGSPARFSSWLEDQTDLNVIRIPRPPSPPLGLFDRLRARGAPHAGSYANAFALEAAAELIDRDAVLMMSLHMDTMACRTGWLTDLRTNLNATTRAAGVRLESSRVRALHVLGLLFDFSLYRPLQLSFRHDMPRYDAGDAISLRLVEAGYDLWACPNTIHEPGLIDRLSADSPYRGLQVDRAFNDRGDVIFLHLGRGIVKTTNPAGPGKTSVDEWLRFATDVVLRP